MTGPQAGFERRVQTALEASPSRIPVILGGCGSGRTWLLQRLRERLRIDVGLILAAALACFIIAAWRESRAVLPRLLALGVVLACVALVPLNEYSNFTRLFDPSVYFTSIAGALTASAGALGLTSAIVLLALLTLLRRGRRPTRLTAAAIVLLVAGLGPFLLRGLARGRSEKQLAADLGLSPHTVHEYVKALHRHFGVQRRSELLARCLAAR